MTDASSSFADEISSWTLPDFSEMSSVKSYLAAPLPVSIMVPASMAAILMQVPRAAQLLRLSTVTEAAAAHIIISSFLVTVLSMTIGSGSEMTVSDSLLLLTQKLWQTLAQWGGFPLMVDRDVSDPSGVTLRSYRPDLVGWINGALVIKAEFKAV
jgi:hypothetical protein